MIRNRAGKDPVSANRPASTSREARLQSSLPAALQTSAANRTKLRVALLAASVATTTAIALSAFHHSSTLPPLAAPRPVPTAAQALATAPPVKIKRHRIADALHRVETQLQPLSRLQQLGQLHPLRGQASWYGDMWHGHKTASGESFDETAMTAAHRTLPLGTRVRVTNLRTLRSVIVRINDRGALPGRVIDLSSGAAEELGILRSGTAPVKLEVFSAAAI